MYLAVQSAQPALRKLGYSEEDSEAIWAYIAEHNSVVNAPGLDPKDYPVFDTAFAEPIGNRFLREEAHLLMMAAAQPFISGAISKTVNMPEQVTVEDVERVYLESWRLGLKAVAIYRDNCKQTQPMSSEKKAAEAGPPPTVRFKLPRKVRSERLKVNAQDLELYVQVGLYPNGQPGEIFLTGPTQGSVVNGFLDGMAKQVSLALQHGTPIVDVVRLWRNMSFEPSGMLSPADSEFTSCLSVLDLLAQELALLFLDVETRHAMGIMTREERKIEVSGNGGHTATPATAVALAPVTTQPTNLGSGSSLQMRIKICSKCGSQMELKGPCFNCPNCGERDGGCS